ncbi:MAG: 1-acyl-sn-glycerol-3-phosphate acyltransferase [Deltaproteobacteria bacterium]|nr:1-acyl-sn-glycerol-3-phosphate acyltransferase [Deltaproteobacteria bacterium]
MQSGAAWTAIARGAERVARSAGSGFLFSIFGIGAVILAAALLPAARLRARAGEPADLVAQRWISRAFAFFIQLGRWIHIWDFEVSGFERLGDRGMLIVANHPTLIDVVLLLARLPQCDCVVKRAAWRNPALAGIVRAAGYVPNDDGAAMIEACVERLQAGRSLLLFPEGSRSPDEGFRRFERGAAHVAIRAGRPVLPVFIDCQPPSLKKGQAWYALPNALMRFRLRAGEPIDVAGLVDANDPIRISARHVNAAFLLHFEAELARARA